MHREITLGIGPMLTCLPWGQIEVRRGSKLILWSVWSSCFPHPREHISWRKIPSWPCGGLKHLVLVASRPQEIPSAIRVCPRYGLASRSLQFPFHIHPVFSAAFCLSQLAICPQELPLALCRPPLTIGHCLRWPDVSFIQSARSRHPSFDRAFLCSQHQRSWRAFSLFMVLSGS